MTPLECATSWCRRGYHPVPIPYRDKGPTDTIGWQKLRIDESNVKQYFNGGPLNIGVLLGDDYGSADIDLDCPEAVKAGSALLPETGVIFGRKSRRRSHYFYRTDPPARTKKYLDPNNKQFTLCELRGRTSSGSIGMQTVVPGSVHPSGEPVEFEPGFDRLPSNIDAGDLQHAVAKVAAAALLAKYWPATGRNQCELALAGVLFRANWTMLDAEVFVLATYEAVPSHDPSALDRVRNSVCATYEKISTGAEATGFPALAALVGKEVAKTVATWLGIADALKAGSRLAIVTPGGQDVAWTARLLRNAEGNLKACLENARIALQDAEEWRGVLAFDSFSSRIVAKGKRPWSGGGNEDPNWTDQDTSLACCWLQREGIMVTTLTTQTAIETVARSNAFHPVKQYLESLTWDRVGRVSRWLDSYLGGTARQSGETSEEANEYLTAVGRCWLISAVARVMQPGCRADCALLLEGKQGIRKSSALKVIGGEWFTDDIDTLGSKDAAHQLEGVWIAELSELDSMQRSDISRTKAFLSRGTDRYRKPYARNVTEHPRQSVFCGSTNEQTYLLDPTGNRRFWPVVCGNIDIERLTTDRDQLWAEAVAMYKTGEPWWFASAETERAAEDQQSLRVDEEPWGEVIMRWCDDPKIRYEGNQAIAPFLESTPDLVVTREILLHAIGKQDKDIDRRHQMIVAKILAAAGWVRERSMVNGRQTRRFRRPE